MKERPILFNAEMVRAILAGKKTQTRRLIKPKPVFSTEFRNPNPLACLTQNNKNGILYYAEDFGNHQYGPPFPCKFGKVGDRLWVKEQWGIQSRVGDFVTIAYKATGSTLEKQLRDWDGDLQQAIDAMEKGWHSPLFMYRWASRITLEITQIRLERLQDISADDAKAEGVRISPVSVFGLCAPTIGYNPEIPRINFKNLWNDIYEQKGYGWETNPWVWAVTFKRLEGKIEGCPC